VEVKITTSGHLILVAHRHFHAARAGAPLAFITAPF
jgi:hypothetical protein